MTDATPSQQGFSQRLLRPLWFFCAALFLFEAWLWDVLGHALTALAALIPFESFNRKLAGLIEASPAPLVLVVFVLPLAIIEPLKILGLWLLTHRHIGLGLLAFLAAKMAGLGVMAFLFEMTRAKLLSMGWFERFYRFVLDLRQWAHDLLEPYKRQLLAAVAPFKARLAQFFGAPGGAGLEAGSGFGRRLVLLRVRVRRLRGLT